MTSSDSKFLSWQPIERAEMAKKLSEPGIEAYVVIPLANEELAARFIERELNGHYCGFIVKRSTPEPGGGR